MRSIVVVALWAQLAAMAATAAPEQELARIEAAYADFNDAHSAVGFIESGLVASYGGKDREAWDALRTELRRTIDSGLASLDLDALGEKDRRAVKLIRQTLQDTLEDTMAPVGRCGDAQRKDLDNAAMHQALYACFAEMANSLAFEGRTVTRVGAFDLLTTMNEPARRKAMFHAFVPLWQALNGKSEANSPYRRMIVATAAEARQQGSPIDAAAQTVGASVDDVERWLEQILDTWRQVSDPTPIEPWDYRYLGGEVERELGETIAREALLPINQRFYADLGADLASWNVVYDVVPRKGKAPLAYADYVRRGRMIDGVWRPTIARVSGSYERGGLGLINELTHENGHVVHFMALRNRPAFMDLGDALFFEAFADVPSWSTYEPAWQQKYLGRSASQATSLRGLFAVTMLDVAWSLFDLRMLRHPERDPNVVWTDITSRYLHIVPHPELSWWAVRVQLVDKPGYMVNYGLGAVVTADIRQRIREQLGAFDAGDPRWYPWLSEHLLVTGHEYESAELLQRFLGRKISPEALLTEIRRIGAPAKRQ